MVIMLESHSKPALFAAAVGDLPSPEAWDRLLSIGRDPATSVHDIEELARVAASYLQLEANPWGHNTQTNSKGLLETQGYSAIHMLGISEQNSDAVLAVLPLVVRSTYWWPLRVANALSARPEFARGLENTTDLEQEPSNPFYTLASCCFPHSTSGFPWTAAETAAMATAVLDRCVVDQAWFPLEKYIKHELEPRLLHLLMPVHARASVLGGSPSTRRAPRTGLRPSLGFSEAENNRELWKAMLLLTLCTAAYLLTTGKWFQINWPLFVTFALNVIEDHDPLFKAEGCKLAVRILAGSSPDEIQTMFTKSGLVDVFIASTRACLLYLPNMTPVDVSRALLEQAYGILFPLTQLSIEYQQTRQKHSQTHHKPSLADSRSLDFSLVSLLNENVLSGIQHVQGSIDAHPVLCVLLQQICRIIEVGGPVFAVSLSRILYVTNQTMSSPATFDSSNYTGILGVCLDIHSKILNHSVFCGDEAKTLLRNYKYDFLGVYSVLYLRLAAYYPGLPLLVDMGANIARMRQIVGDAEWRADTTQMCLANQKLAPLFE